MAEYGPAPVVAELARPLIEEHHPDLRDVPIVYVFRSSATSKGGRKVLARARLIRGLHAFLPALASGDLTRHPEFGYDFFCMEAAADVWHHLTDDQRVALVDHELCHFGVAYDPDDNTRSLWIRGHDVEEFIAVARRHGQWEVGLQALVAACGGGR